MWRRQYGCTAAFAWKYDRAGNKLLAVTEIDFPVYRGDGPAEGSLKAALTAFEDPHPVP